MNKMLNIERLVDRRSEVLSQRTLVRILHDIT
ncbi:hypothetical protein PQC43_gp103 [Escherichia phage vB_EcoP-101114UKE3]|uniref:Uncharacterized protein n=1 Tax=Escherichia phage vB_EcoP-101114UKE3 TaxID=2865794 RepID=A0AAE8C367_9CAUD|nr:hypothetical protein PQC43_gp103 [Escherichia phage vB_EcoP-101114UKE3]QZI79234.1 hypothetical protein 101114UKE3_103 [Escherichia phage vB_EcoP-101114UKE3]USM81207.1 hypothetical protein 101114BS3_080 [Escherichia phage vB_EcoP-101114BS3]